MKNLTTNADFIEAVEADDDKAIPYSGRGMFGARCVAITLTVDTPCGFIATIMAHAAEEGPGYAGKLADMLQHTKSDSMGLGTILYWPSVKWPDEVPKAPYTLDVEDK